MNINKTPGQGVHSMRSAAVTGLDEHGNLTAARRKSVGPQFDSDLRRLRPETISFGGNGYKGKPRISKQELDKVIARQFPDLSVVMECPRTTEKIQALLRSYKDSGRLVMLFQISPASLALIHPGSTSAEIAKHLHPYAPGNATKHKLEDEKLITVVWEYPRPKSGPLHPEATELTDGSLRAAFLTKDAGNLKEFETYSDRVFDTLHGNPHGMDKNAFKRVFHAAVYQFRSRGHGAVEGWSRPRYTGAILATLLAAGLPISASLIGWCYLVNNSITNYELRKVKPSHKQHGVESNDGSTYSLGS